MAFIRYTYLWQCPVCRRIRISHNTFEFIKLSISKCPTCRVNWVLKG